jgi:hypothetical protein
MQQEQMKKPRYSFHVKRSGTKWVAEMVADVQDSEILYKTPAVVRRDLERTFVAECEKALFHAPEEVEVEAQLGLFGDATITFRGIVVKPKRRWCENTSWVSELHV